MSQASLPQFSYSLAEALRKKGYQENEHTCTQTEPIQCVLAKIALKCEFNEQLQVIFVHNYTCDEHWGFIADVP